MRRIAIALSFLVLCAGAWAQNQLPRPVQVCPASATTCASIVNVTSGNLIFIGAHSEGALTTPTDTRSTSWTLVDSHTGGANAYVWCGVLGSSGTETVTLTGSLSFQGLTWAEFPAFAGITCTKDASANGATASGTVTTSSITTAKNGDLMICYMSNFHSNATVVPTVGATFLGVGTQNGSDAGGMGYAWAGTNGSYHCTFDGGSDTSAGYVIAAFKPSAATFVTTSLPTAALSNSYSFTLQCVGGVGAYTFSVSSGALPTGLSINSSTGAITGTPTTGTATPTFKCDDGTNNATSALTLTVNSTVGTISKVSDSGSTAGAASVSIGTVSAVGNCILVASWQGFSSSNKISPPTDSLSTHYNFIGVQFRGTNATYMSLFGGVATSTGSDTVTLSSGVAAAAVQFSSCQLFLDTAVSTAGTNAGSVTINGPSVTTLAPNSEIWSVINGFSSSTTWTAGTGFTADATVTGSNPEQAIHANESTVGSYTPSFVQTGNAAGQWTSWAIALRPGTSGVVASGAVRHKSQVF